MNRFHEEWAIVATIDPVDGNGGTAASDIIDLSKYSELVVIVQLGVLAASSTNTFTFEASALSDGSSGTLVTSKSTATVNTDDGQQRIITILPEEVQSQLGSTYRYGKVTQAGSAHSQLLAVLVLGKVKYGPATEHDLSSVQTVVD